MGFSDQNRYNGAPDPAALWNLVENVRGYLPFQIPAPDQINGLTARPHQQPGSRAPKRSVHATVLALLADGPRHGGQIVREIAEADDRGAETPGAAEIYPELQLLVDDGLATVEETDGRRTFTLTEAGRAEASDTAAQDTGTAPWDSLTQWLNGHGDLPKSGVKLGQTVHQMAMSGNEEQRRRATELLDETRRKIYGILAEESGAED